MILIMYDLIIIASQYSKYNVESKNWTFNLRNKKLQKMEKPQIFALQSLTKVLIDALAAPKCRYLYPKVIQGFLELEADKNPAERRKKSGKSSAIAAPPRRNWVWRRGGAAIFEDFPDFLRRSAGFLSVSSFKKP